MLVTWRYFFPSNCLASTNHKLSYKQALGIASEYAKPHVPVDALYNVKQHIHNDRVDTNISASLPRNHKCEDRA